MKKITCLGIESTAHTFGCGIVSYGSGKCNILANEKASYTTQSGGIHPREAAEHHYKNAVNVINSALEKSNHSMKEIDVVSFSQGPGLGNCLKAGAVAARSLALKYKKPLLGVNHCVAHIEIGKALTNAKDPIVVYSSGANTQIIGYENGKYRVFGETLDIGIGNLLDSFGRKIGLGFPAGPIIDKWCAEEFSEKDFIELPYTVKGMDLAFSGLQTAAETIWLKEKQKIEKNSEKKSNEKEMEIKNLKKIGENENNLEKKTIEKNVEHGKKEIELEKFKKNLACSLMLTAFSMLTEVSERALAHTEKKEILLTGGVAASRTLRKMLETMAIERKAKIFVPPIPTCTDNGAMIAWLGLIEFKNGNRMKLSETGIKPMQRTDQVKVNWAID